MHCYSLIMARKNMLFSQLTAQQRKDIKALHRKQSRDENGEFLAEGVKVCTELLDSPYLADCVIIRHNAGDEAMVLADKFHERGVAVFSAPHEHFNAMCDAQTPQDILAVVRYMPYSPTSGISNNVIILDAVADPGNVGTIIRTADWFGFQTIILGRGCADRYNPKVIRSTMGSLFHCNVFQVNDITEFAKLHLRDYALCGAMLSGTDTPSVLKNYTRIAIVLGNESAGISSSVQSILTHSYHIPGEGKAESLNVAIAAAISMYSCVS